MSRDALIGPSVIYGDGRRLCEQCGMPFRPRSNRHRFHTTDCWRINYAARRRETEAQYRLEVERVAHRRLAAHGQLVLEGL